MDARRAGARKRKEAPGLAAKVVRQGQGSIASASRFQLRSIRGAGSPLAAAAFILAGRASVAAPRALARTLAGASRPFSVSATPPPLYTSRKDYEASLDVALPAGFRVGCTSFDFRPQELADKVARMSVTLIALDKPTESFAAVFTRNAFPGAPVVIGRERVAHARALQAVVVNNKISNVCARDGVATSERACAGAASALGLSSGSLVFPSSTGIIGWRLPADELIASIPSAAAALQRDTILPAAIGICTTDLYPKVRAVTLPGGARIVGIAKGAGMVEPGLATMLVYLLTDAIVDVTTLRAALRHAIEPSFNSLSIDSDTSTSDTVLALASNEKPILKPSSTEDAALVFQRALTSVCTLLSEDIVRNGEGVAHVIRVSITRAPSYDVGRSVGKAIVNSPLFKCAVAGNDPNVGRLVAAIGKCLGNLPHHGGVKDLSAISIAMGGIPIFRNGTFDLDPSKEALLVQHLKEAQLWESAPTIAAGATPVKAAGTPGSRYAAGDVSYAPPVSYPPHERCVEVHVDLGCGTGGVDAIVLGADLTHEYVAENGDYRS